MIQVYAEEVRPSEGAVRRVKRLEMWPVYKQKDKAHKVVKGGHGQLMLAVYDVGGQETDSALVNRRYPGMKTYEV